MIYRGFNRFSQKRAHNFVPLPYPPENNDIPVKTPPAGFDPALARKSWTSSP